MPSPLRLGGSPMGAALDQLRNRPPRVPTTDLISWGLSHYWAGIGASLPVEVTTMTIGEEVALVFLPGEPFADLGLTFKRGSPYRTTFVIELTNCVQTIYIPTRAAYAGVSYEVTISAVKPGNGELLVETACSCCAGRPAPNRRTYAWDNQFKTSCHVQSICGCRSNVPTVRGEGSERSGQPVRQSTGAFGVAPARRRHVA